MSPLTVSEEIERDYNLRAAFPDYTLFFERWRTRSQQTRDRLPCIIDVPYGLGLRERVDFFPASAQPAPLLVYIHGGYWRSMDKSDFSFLADPFVRRGVSLALINYDLFPGTTMSRLVVQVRTAYAWIAENAARFGIAPRQLHLAGWSAGAHLAAMILCGSGSGAVASLLAISGVYDLTPILQTSANADLRLDRAEVELNSPIRLLRKAPACPVSVVCGGNETEAFRQQSSALASTWSLLGVNLNVVQVAGLHHYAAMDALGDSSSPVFAEEARLLAG